MITTLVYNGLYLYICPLDINIMTCIYEIKNLITKDVYIGSSVNFKERKRRHLRDLKKGNHHSIILQRAYNKYGKSNFVFNILIECNKNLLEKFENEFLIKLKPKYNICKVAYKTTGRICSEKTRLKHRDNALKNNYVPPKETWKKKQKPVIMLDKNTLKELKEFESISAACRYIGRDSSFSSVISTTIRKGNNAYGYKWKYKKK